MDFYPHFAHPPAHALGMFLRCFFGIVLAATLPIDLGVEHVCCPLLVSWLIENGDGFFFHSIGMLKGPNNAVLRTRVLVTGRAWLARPRHRPFR